MTSDDQPSKELPVPDETGHIILLKIQKNILQSFFAVVVLWVFAILSLFYWYEKFLNGGIPDALNDSRVTALALGGLVAILIAPMALLNFIFPPKLDIDDQGIKYREKGITRKVNWQDIREVKLKSMPSNTSAAPRMMTIVVGRYSEIKWMPVFGIPTAVLASYIRTRQSNASGSFTKIHPLSDDRSLDTF